MMSFLDETGLTQAVSEIKAFCVQTFAAIVHSHSTATPSTSGTGGTDGFMSAADKEKLNGIEAGANAYVLPAATTSTLGGVKPDGTTVTVDSDGTIHSAGGGGGAVSGVKGNEESTYRTGNVNLTPANIGAAESSHNHAASDITSGTLAVNRGGTGQSTLANARDAMNVHLATTDGGYATTDLGYIYNVAVSDFTPFAGAILHVKFLVAGGSVIGNGMCLKINNEIKQVYAGGSAVSSGNPISWSLNAICEFIYDGTHWHYIGNNIDGYDDYAAGQAITDLATWTGANSTSYAAYGSIQSQVYTLRDSVDCGSETMSTTIASGTYAQFTVTFNKTFNTKPSVVAISDVTSVGVAVDYITKTNCEIYMRNLGSTNVTVKNVCWIAMA